MSKVTSKLQVTIPRTIADRYRIRPGDDIDWVPTSNGIRVVPLRPQRALNEQERLDLFDRSTERQEERNRKARRLKTPSKRGWSREELYTRGSAG